MSEYTLETCKKKLLEQSAKQIRIVKLEKEERTPNPILGKLIVAAVSKSGLVHNSSCSSPPKREILKTGVPISYNKELDLCFVELGNVATPTWIRGYKI